MHPTRLLIVLFFLLLIGCRPAPTSTAKPPKTMREWLARFAELRYSRLTENAFLREELFRVESESGLPNQFAIANDAPDGAHGPLKSITSAAQLNHLDRRLAHVFPQAEFAIAERHIAEIERLRSEYSELRKDLDRFSLAKDWTIDLAFNEGSLFAGHFIPCIEAAIKLELTIAGLTTRKAEWQAAKESSLRVWRAIEILAAQPHLECRVLAAKLRTSALGLLESMLKSPACDASQVRGFRDLLAQCLADWPADDRVWRGERARALHFFEMVRDGQILSLANEDLEMAIDDHGGAKDFGIWLHAHVDADELYYLEAMRRLITSCETPFADRNATLRDLSSDLQRLAKSDADPLLSRVMLLGDIESGMKWQASDRLHCEVMLIALDHAVGDGSVSSTLQRSPLTGREYRVTELQRLIRVDGDSEIGELGYLVSAPRYDLELARAVDEEQLKPEPATKTDSLNEMSKKPNPSKSRRSSVRRTP